LLGLFAPPLYPREFDAEITFYKNARGEVDRLVLVENGVTTDMGCRSPISASLRASMSGSGKVGSRNPYSLLTQLRALAEPAQP
jgi:hypothetical protein